MTASFPAWFTRVLTGMRARWHGCTPVAGQRVYFANHTGNFDSVLLWASLPVELRCKTRSVAARDHWEGSGVREWLAARVFQAVLIGHHAVTRENNPLVPMLDALREGESLIIFPEGTRNPDDEVNPFKPGLFHLAKTQP